MLGSHLLPHALDPDHGRMSGAVVEVSERFMTRAPLAPRAVSIQSDE
jgi:hypothetical protein